MSTGSLGWFKDWFNFPPPQANPYFSPRNLVLVKVDSSDNLRIVIETGEHKKKYRSTFLQIILWDSSNKQAVRKPIFSQYQNNFQTQLQYL